MFQLPEKCKNCSQDCRLKNAFQKQTNASSMKCFNWDRQGDTDEFGRRQKKRNICKPSDP